MLLQQFLHAIRQISSEFFIFQQDSALMYTALDANNTFLIALPNVEQFQKSAENL